MIRVVVADDHNLVRQGICRLLEETGEIQVIGEADNGIDALKLARLLSPDVLILDISMSPINGLDTLKQGIVILPPAGFIALLELEGKNKDR